MGIGRGLKARTLESDRTGYLIFFYLFPLSWFLYRKIGIIIDLPHLMVVRIELNQIKSLAQCLMHRDRSVNCSQNHDQEVGSEWLCVLWLLFLAKGQACSTERCSGVLQRLGCGPGEGRFYAVSWRVTGRPGCWAQLCLCSLLASGSSPPLWGLRVVSDVLTEHLLCAEHCARSGVTEMDETQPLLSTMLSASWRKLMGKRNGLYLFLTF